MVAGTHSSQGSIREYVLAIRHLTLGTEKTDSQFALDLVGVAWGWKGEGRSWKEMLCVCIRLVAYQLHNITAEGVVEVIKEG